MEPVPVRVDPSSYVDPNGVVFWHGTGVFRAVRPERSAYYRELLDTGVLADLEARHRLVHSAPTDLRPAGIDCDLVFEHAVVTPPTYCVEWAPSLLKAAALQVLDLSIELTSHDAMLQDAYPWNTLFPGPEPVFVDVTSIVPGDDRLLWPAYDQFLAYFLRPLQLTAMGRGRLARALLLDNITGVDLDTFVRHATIRHRLRHPLGDVNRSLERLLQRRRTVRARVRKSVDRPRITITAEMRMRFLRRVRRKVARLSFPAAGDVWRRYYDELPGDVDRDAKVARVGALLDRTAPATVLDLGANTGVFAVEAARRGARVVAVDSSEACMESLAQTAAGEGLAIVPLVADVLSPTPAFGFLGTQYPPLFERVRSELVLCLGLMHHLHLPGRQSFDRITDLLAAATTRWLVFEYVDREDANIERISSRRVIDYTLDSVLEHLGRRFVIEGVEPSDRPTRRLVLARLRDG